MKTRTAVRALCQAGGNVVAGQEAKRLPAATKFPSPSAPILTHCSCLAIKDICIMMPMLVPNVCFGVGRGLWNWLVWRMNFIQCWSRKERGSGKGWWAAGDGGPWPLCEEKKTCSPVKSDAVNCEIAAKSCQMLLQVVIVSGEEEKKKKKTVFQLSARLFSSNSSAVRMLLCSRTPYQVLSLALSLFFFSVLVWKCQWSCPQGCGCTRALSVPQGGPAH